MRHICLISTFYCIILYNYLWKSLQLKKWVKRQYPWFYNEAVSLFLLLRLYFWLELQSLFCYLMLFKWLFFCFPAGAPTAVPSRLPAWPHWHVCCWPARFSLPTWCSTRSSRSTPFRRALREWGNNSHEHPRVKKGAAFYRTLCCIFNKNVSLLSFVVKVKHVEGSES